MSMNIDRIDFLTQPVVQTYKQVNQPFKLQGSAFTHTFEIVQNYSDSSHTCGKCFIIPPHITECLKNHEEKDIKDQALQNAETDKYFREARKGFLKEKEVTFHWPDQHSNTSNPLSVSTPPSIVRSVYDAKHKEQLPGVFVMSDDTKTSKGKTSDESAKLAMDNALKVFNFYLNTYRYNSIDGKGMPIMSTIHFGKNYENAFWNGKEMVYGDGSQFFDSFVKYLDVVGHELTHGVTGNRLKYKAEAGALNEHFSDVMGYLVKLYTNQQATNDSKATWTVADGIILDGKNHYPLRSFAAPGTAYDTKALGKDPQPAKYSGLYKGADDNGGVHINSGIPNHAFYLFAKALGGNAWEQAGLIWFTTMMTPNLFKSNASMADFANATIKTAKNLFPKDINIENALRNAWKSVEVLL